MTKPGFWQYETSGTLRPAVFAYLQGGPMTAPQIALMRAYLQQWIEATVWDANPYAQAADDARLARMRARIDQLTTREAISKWIADAVDMAMDPL